MESFGGTNIVLLFRSLQRQYGGTGIEVPQKGEFIPRVFPEGVNDLQPFVIRHAKLTGGKDTRQCFNIL